MGLVASPDKARKVSSTAAASFLEGVIAMIATREEEQLTWTRTWGTEEKPVYTVRDGIYAVRKWTRANGMEKPNHQSADTTAKPCGHFLNNWKWASKGGYGGKCLDRKSCEVVMRDVPWWPDFVSRISKNKDDWKKLNGQLLDGYASREEPEFEGKKNILYGGGNKSVYDKLHNFITYGRGATSSVDTALAGLPESRAKWYRDKYDEARRLGKHIRNKRKLDELGSTSTDSLPDDPSGEVPMDDDAEGGDAEDGDDGSDDDE
jgi:hypothetical protein